MFVVGLRVFSAVSLSVLPPAPIFQSDFTMHHRPSPIFSLILLAFPVLSIAQDAGNVAALPSMSVVAERVRPDVAPQDARNAYRTPESSATHTQTITREEIEQLRPRDVFELLNSASGVISTQGSRKGFSGLMIRGDSNFRWIIDGAYLQPTMASRILRSLPVMAIEEVKVVRGGSALTMGPMVGSASPGGAPVDGFVIVRTRKPAKTEAQVRLAAESFDTTQAGVWLGKTYALDAGKTYVAGVLTYANTNGPSDKMDNGASYNVGSKSTSGLVKTGFESAGWLLDLMAYKDDSTFQIPNASSHGSGQGSWYMDPSNTDILSLSGSRTWNAQNTTLLSLSHGESKQKFWTAKTAAGPYSAVQNDNEITHLNLRHNIDMGKTRLVLGGDYMHWDAPNGQQYYEGIQREEVTKGVFVQVEQKLVDDRLTLDASYRRDQVDVLHGLDYYTGGAQPFGGVNSPLKTTNKTLEPAVFSSFGSSWQLSKDWKLAGRYSQGKQATDGLNPVPGVTLSDDEQSKWELGLEGQVSSWFNPSLNLFQRDVKNEKTAAGYTYVANNNSTQRCRGGILPATGATAPKASSILTPCYTQADTTRGGFELAVSGNFGMRSSYRASLTHFTTLSNTASATTPNDILDISVSHGMGAYTLSGAIKQVASYKGSATDTVAWLGGYTRLDLGLGYDFKVSGTPVRATIYGRNLTDQKYETNNGVQDVGRVLGIELLASF
jgi:iron complex outermembrane receptor protein